MKIKSEMDQIKFCAFCPSVCRIYYPRGCTEFECLTPSSLAYLCYAVTNNHVSYTEDVRMILSNLKVCESCEKACPYNFIISTCIINICKNFVK